MVKVVRGRKINKVDPFNLLNSAAITLPELFTFGNASGDVKNKLF